MLSRAPLLLACLAWLATVPSASAATPQTVSFRSEDGVNLMASLYLPSRPGPAVILLHMQTRSREDWQLLAGRLADAGLAALALDFRGHGASDPSPQGVDPQDLSRLVMDVKAARGYLASRSDIAQGRVGIVGASIGANLAILYAAGEPSVRSIALLSAGLDYRGLRTEAAMTKFGKRAALLVASDEDSYAANSARKLAKQEGGTREIRLLTGAGHGTVMLSRQADLAAALVDWFRRTLL